MNFRVKMYVAWRRVRIPPRSPASHRRRRKGNPVPGGITGSPCSWGDLNTGTWSSRLGESRIWDGKIWSWVPRDSDPRITALARPSSNSKWQIHPLVREGTPHQQTRNCLTVIKIWSCAPDGGLTPRQTGRLTVCRNITLTLAKKVLTEKGGNEMKAWKR
jgi:hypothetical protein